MNQGTQDSAALLEQKLFNEGSANVVALTDGANLQLDAPSVASYQSVTLGASRTIIFPVAVAGGKIKFKVSQDGTGSRVATWSVGAGAIKWAGGSSTLSTAASSVDVVEAWSDGTNWYATLTKAFA